MNTRIVIEQAKGVLSERADTTLGEAFTMMRKFARRRQQPLIQVAVAVLESGIDIEELPRSEGAVPPRV